jgi:uncharacterized membrane protein YeaQ/YmgE (transglycosylase-associated protein family)
MTIIAFIVLGIVSGFIASQIVNRQGSGILVDLVLGILGAFAGGFLFNLVGVHGLTGFNLWSLFVSVVGSVALLGTYHAIRGATRRV